MENQGLGEYVKYKDREIFERDSSALKDKNVFGKIIDELFSIAAFLNDGREPEGYIILPKNEQGQI